MPTSPDPNRFGAINEVIHVPEIELPLYPGGVGPPAIWDPYTQYVLDLDLDTRLNAILAGTVLDSETVRDVIGATLVGTGVVSISVNDVANTITVSSTATVNDTDANLKNRANHTGTQPSSTISDFAEASEDAIAAILARSTQTGITWTYDDAAGTLSATAAGGGGGGIDAESARDAIGTALVGVGVITITVNDAADTITISSTATANSTDAVLLARVNHTGTQSADTLTDGTTNKAFLATERTKLTGITTGATANSSDATLLARANHTGTQSADTLTDGTTNKAFLATERTKLTGIATAATANLPDATLLGRANHTGTQAATTITGLAAVATSGAKADVGLGNVDNTSDANKPVSTAQATALAGKQVFQGVAATVSASGAAVPNDHNTVNATGGVRSLSLPTGQPEGTELSVEKVDASTNSVSITGNIRGVASSSISLSLQFETLVLRADSAGSWWPYASHKTKSALDSLYKGIANLPAGSTVTINKDLTTGFWPVSYATDGTPVYTGGSASVGLRPTSRADITVFWKGADPSPGIVSSGASGMRDGIDVRLVTP